MNAHRLMIVMLALAVSGCVYEAEHEGLSCSTQDDCASGATCVEDYCVLDDTMLPDTDVTDAPDAEIPQAARVEITPPTAEVVIGATVQLTAAAFLSDDTPILSPEVVWTSSDETIATVDGAGLTTGQRPGTATILATVDDVFATATVTVLAPVDSVVIEPAAPSIGQGRTIQLTARALDGNGDELTGRNVDWSSADVTIAEVDATGLATALEVGSVEITATADGVSGTATLEVTANDVVSVVITPEDGLVELGLIEEFTAEIRDVDDEPLDPRNRDFAWTITNAAVASLSTRASAPQVARVQGQQLGDTSISVTVDGGATADLAIEVILRPIASVEIDPLGETVPVGSTRTLTTQVKDPNGQPITGRMHTWTSSDEAILTVGSDGTLTAIAPGTATVSVDVEGFGATLDVNTAFLLERLAAGDDHTCGLNSDGVALCWGRNDQGQLGAGNVGGSSAKPVVVSGGHIFTDIRAGDGFTCAIDNAQAIHCWGQGGRLGTSGSSNTPVVIPTITATAIAAGNRHACALLTSGEVHCWGEGSAGELGDGTSSDSDTPIKVDLTPVGNVSALSIGNNHSCVATDAGKTYCWGVGNGGALGVGTTSPEPTPVEVTTTTAFVQLSLGEAISCGRTAALDVYCWGSNIQGRLGVGDMDLTEATTPMQLPGVKMDAISLGAQHGCGINAPDDIVYCWGSGTNFRLGTNSEDHAYAPIANAGDLAAIDVTAGGAHSCAIDQTNVPYCWGNNSNGRVGTAAGATIAVPTLVWPTP